MREAGCSTKVSGKLWGDLCTLTLSGVEVTAQHRGLPPRLWGPRTTPRGPRPPATPRAQHPRRTAPTCTRPAVRAPRFSPKPWLPAREETPRINLAPAGVWGPRGRDSHRRPLAPPPTRAAGWEQQLSRQRSGGIVKGSLAWAWAAWRGRGSRGRGSRSRAPVLHGDPGPTPQALPRASCVHGAQVCTCVVCVRVRVCGVRYVRVRACTCACAVCVCVHVCTPLTLGKEQRRPPSPGLGGCVPFRFLYISSVRMCRVCVPCVCACICVCV